VHNVVVGVHVDRTAQVAGCAWLCVCVSRPDRLRDIADRFNLDQDAVLDNVLYARAYTSQSFHLSLLLASTTFSLQSLHRDGRFCLIFARTAQRSVLHRGP